MTRLTRILACLAVAIGIGLAGGASATTTPPITLSPNVGPPTSAFAVSATGLGAYERVDVYFDMTDVALAGTDATGAITGFPLTAPASAVPGRHWISLEGRRSGVF